MQRTAHRRARESGSARRALAAGLGVALVLVLLGRNASPVAALAPGTWTVHDLAVPGIVACANDINERGTIVGDVRRDPGVRAAFIIDPSGQQTDLGGGTLATTAVALAVNDDDVVTG